MATSARGTRATSPPADLRLPGIVLGVGLGGFVDGILLHQLLQWHHMLSSTDTDRVGVRYYDPDTVSGLEMNTVWDGVFHTVCWFAVLIGLALLYSRVTHRRRRVWTSRVLWGWVLVGWGLFNLVEGVVDHHVLGIHHVHDGPHRLWWDLGFLALGALLLVGGYLLQRGGRPLAPDAPDDEHGPDGGRAPDGAATGRPERDA
ncbi:MULTISPECIES: DUF2243 domain-containing protein [Streptomyces]|uniref:DUF2243 domain-containing protein n=1 Tax=Streptomyces TaxID=1883 RepID=UPI002248D7FB|nr:DUF2243 domain-containing protein [Streptomyces sp. JHD 1]MCX2970847.1 DUF2243 domain-containing protein [Streptomyces sp. JHD 1]